MGKRRKGREIVLQSLYASLMGGGDVLEVLADQLLRRDSAPETVDFARDLAGKYKTNRTEIERWLRTLVSVRWDPSRLGALERCILHLGLTELKYSPEVPFRAVINEACELSHRYCEDGAVGFINGVLDHAARQIYPGQTAGVPEEAAVVAADPADHEAMSDDAPDAADLDADFGDTPLRGSAGPGQDDA